MIVCSGAPLRIICDKLECSHNNNIDFPILAEPCFKIIAVGEQVKKIA